MEKKYIVSALIGLVGALSNNGKTENTDQIIANSLLSDDQETMVAKIHKEKFTISPDCASCQNPCGNTSDYEVSKFDETEPELIELKNQLLEVMTQKVEALSANGLSQLVLPDEIYRGIAYFGYDLEKDSYLKLIEDIRNL